MEQQEKERAQVGGQSTIPFTSIANFTSSPRSLPLAAAAAWGNWRKGRNAPASGETGATVNRTPSRSSASTQSLSSGLLTPPLSETQRGIRPSVDSRRGAIVSSENRSGSNILGDTLPEHDKSYRHSPPVTPSTTRTIKYNIDAMSADAAPINDALGLKVGSGNKEEDEDLFGRSIAAFPEHS
ncbi:MAG: hypothetical protein L6R41_002549 [Letrouitia leprolyta]|nr:MAG: hypothetical protein L6R41_002549 [Letrouitia leprolyta]